MKTIYTILVVLLSSTLAFGQFNITGPNHPPSNPINCANNSDINVVNFLDDGGAAGNYAPGQNQVLTICPDVPNGTPKIQASFGGLGFSWDVHSSDSLIVFDGPSILSPRIGA